MQTRIKSIRKDASPKGKALLLGMVYSEEWEPKRGQEFRDRVRCEALENRGEYEVFTLDNKHHVESSKPGKHCRANFSDPRRMLQSIHSVWGDDISFDVIILDYFFSPAGWARERWTDHFFRETLPAFASRNLLKSGGSIWLPYLDCVKESMEDFQTELNIFYKIHLVEDVFKNPLFEATEDVENELARCPDLLTNETQIAPLHNFSTTPFCELEFIGNSIGQLNSVDESACRLQRKAVHIITPTKGKRNAKLVSKVETSNLTNEFKMEGKLNVISADGETSKNKRKRKL